MPPEELLDEAQQDVAGDEGSGVSPSLESPPAAQPQAAIPIESLQQALVGAYQQIAGAQPRQAPADPFDSMNQSQKDQLSNMMIADPVAAARYISETTRRQAQAEFAQTAIPFVVSQANQIVEMFKLRKRTADPYYANVEPGFDRLMQGVDVTPLVSMHTATANNELEMRWKMARADVLETELKRNKKAEPRLLANNSQNSPASKTRTAEDDGWMKAMKDEYGLTDAQMAEIEELL